MDRARRKKNPQLSNRRSGTQASREAHPTSQITRKKILDEAIRLTHGDRDKNYGTPLVNHQRIAAIWSVILGKEITPSQVALCMAGVKIARLVETPDHLDSFIDGAAYLAIAGEIA